MKKLSTKISAFAMVVTLAATPLFAYQMAQKAVWNNSSGLLTTERNQSMSVNSENHKSSESELRAKMQGRFMPSAFSGLLSTDLLSAKKSIGITHKSPMLRAADGAIVPPYYADFEKNGLEGWTVIDANNDGYTWKHDLNNHEGTGTVYTQNGYHEAMNDWLITPPLQLEAGHSYELSFQATADWAYNKSFPQKFEVMLGTDNTVEAMTITVIPETIIENLTGFLPAGQRGDDYKEFSKYIVPETSGVYYIGWHSMSDKDMFYLTLKDIVIESGVTDSAPGQVTNLTAVPGAFGALTCTLSFNAPSVDFNGDALTGLSSIEIYRGDELIKTIDNPTPGEALSYQDTLAEGGEVTYYVAATNSGGQGVKNFITTFVGYSLPVAPDFINISRTDVEGEVCLTWGAVTIDENGTEIGEGDVTYSVCTLADDGYTWTPIVENLKTTTYTYQACPKGEQAFVQLAVYPYTYAGRGEGKLSEQIVTGTPYDGLDETFADGEVHYDWSYSTIYTTYWAWPELATDGEFKDVNSVTGDNGFLYFYYEDQYYGVNFYSAMISLENLTAPGLTFYVFNNSVEDHDSLNPVIVSVKDIESDNWITLLDSTVAEVCTEGLSKWTRVMIPLGAFAGKTIQIQLTSEAETFKYTFFDDIKIGNINANDLAVTAIKAPEKVATGTEYDVNVIIANNGTVTASDYSVELYADDQLIATKEGSEITSGSSATVTFKVTMPAIATEDVSLYAKVVYESDAETSNNESDKISVTPLVSTLPAPAQLTGESTEKGISLAWDEPDMTSDKKLELTGYNIYRDGVKINDALVEETEYLDKLVSADQTYTYQVTAVYTGEGESSGSNSVTVECKYSGIYTVTESAVIVKAENKTISVTNAQGLEVSVYDASGLLYHFGTGDANVKVNQGIYFVKAGSKVVKTIVR